MHEKFANRCYSNVLLIVSLATLAACGLANDPASRIERAAEHQANGEYRASMIELKNALQDEPDNVEARITQPREMSLQQVEGLILPGVLRFQRWSLQQAGSRGLAHNSGIRRVSRDLDHHRARIGGVTDAVPVHP